MKTKVTRRGFLGVLGAVGATIGCKNAPIVETTKGISNTEFLYNILKDCENNITQSNVEYILSVLLAEDVSPEHVLYFCRTAFTNSSVFFEATKNTPEYILDITDYAAEKCLVNKVMIKANIARLRA